MGSGAYYRAKQRTGGLAGALAPILDQYKAMQEQERAKQALQGIQERYSAFQNNLNGLDAVNASYEPTKVPAARPNMFPNATGVVDDILEKSVRPDNRLPDNDMVNMFGKKVETPRFNPLEKQTKANDALEQFLINTMTDENLSKANPNAVNTILSLAQGKVGRFAPETFNTPISKNTVGWLGNKGNVKPNSYYHEEVKKETPRNPFMEVGSDGFYQAWDDKTNSFVKTNLKAPAKEYLTDKQINGDGSGEDSASMDISKELINLEKDWNQLETMRTIPSDKEVGNGMTAKQARELTFGNVKAQTDGLANKINSQYKGFEKIYRQLMQNPDVKTGDPDQIASAVEQYMKGTPTETRTWMKNLLSKRFFK